jgi:hypothetical protein
LIFDIGRNQTMAGNSDTSKKPDTGTTLVTSEKPDTSTKLGTSREPDVSPKSGTGTKSAAFANKYRHEITGGRT